MRARYRLRHPRRQAALRRGGTAPGRHCTGVALRRGGTAPSDSGTAPKSSHATISSFAVFVAFLFAASSRFFRASKHSCSSSASGTNGTTRGPLKICSPHHQPAGVPNTPRHCQSCSRRGDPIERRTNRHKGAGLKWDAPAMMVGVAGGCKVGGWAMCQHWALSGGSGALASPSGPEFSDLLPSGPHPSPLGPRPSVLSHI